MENQENITTTKRWEPLVLHILNNFLITAKCSTVKYGTAQKSTVLVQHARSQDFSCGGAYLNNQDQLIS